LGEVDAVMTPKKPPKNCPYSVRVTCDLTPPHDFIQETHHTSRETALKMVRKAKVEFKGCPGLKVTIILRGEEKPRRTAWDHILKV
jgi:hypothetical protein